MNVDSFSDDSSSVDSFSDEELTALALAADPDLPLLEDAQPIADPHAPDQLLPSWYMPVARAREGTPWRRVVVAVLILAFLVINVLGLCITYGRLEIA